MSDCDDDDEITTDCRGNKRIETICPAAAAAAAASRRRRSNDAGNTVLMSLPVSLMNSEKLPVYQIAVYAAYVPGVRAVVALLPLRHRYTTKRRNNIALWSSELQISPLHHNVQLYHCIQSVPQKKNIQDDINLAAKEFDRRIRLCVNIVAKN